MSEIVILIAFFLVVMAGVVSAGYYLVVRGRAEGSADAAVLIGAASSGNAESAADALIGAFQTIGRIFPAARAPNDPLRRSLVAAGYRDESAAPVFYGIKCAAALLAAMLVFWAGMLFGVTLGSALLATAGGAGFGFLLPDRVLKRAITSRQARLRRAVPPALDLLVLGLEAGQGLDAAIVDAAHSLKTTHPDLASELTVLHLELRTGASRAEALHNLADRTAEREIRKLTALLLDTDRFGTTIAPALRDHAKYLRIRFRQSAQERARKIGVKLIFPVFFLIFPSVMLVTLGPACILIFQQLNAMAAH